MLLPCATASLYYNNIAQVPYAHDAVRISRFPSAYVPLLKVQGPFHAAGSPSLVRALRFQAVKFLPGVAIAVKAIKEAWENKPSGVGVTRSRCCRCALLFCYRTTGWESVHYALCFFSALCVKFHFGISVGDIISEIISKHSLAIITVGLKRISMLVIVKNLTHGILNRNVHITVS